MRFVGPNFTISKMTSRCVRIVLRYTLIFACLASGCCAELRIATYNLRNYLVMDRMVSERWRPSYPKRESEKAVVRKIIRETDPDVLAIQEIGTVDFLEELRTDLAREGLHYSYAVHLSGPDPDRHIALLSKAAATEVVKHTDLSFKYLDRRERVKRGMLEVSYDDGEGGIFKLFVVHLKSRYAEDEEDPESNLRRTREAEACRNRIIDRTYNLKKESFMILGDFNDSPNTAPLRRFYRRGDLEIGRRVPAQDRRGEVWTYFYKKQGQYSNIDGFIASPAILPRIRGGRGHIVDGPDVLTGSDHRMVYLDLMVQAMD